MHIFAHFTLQHMNERDIVSNVRRNVAGHTNEGDKATHVSMNNACKYSLDKSTPLKRFQSLLLLLDIALGAFTLLTSRFLKSRHFDPTIYTCAKNREVSVSRNFAIFWLVVRMCDHRLQCMHSCMQSMQYS